jgi:hypothetical protein
MSLLNRILLWTEDHFLKILVTATVISGAVAAYQRSSETPPEWQPWGFVWGSLMVVKELVGSGQDVSVSALDLCAKLFKLTIAAGALKVYFRVVGVRLDDLRARLRSGHVTIVGERDLAAALALSVRRAGVRVTLVAGPGLPGDDLVLRRADVVVIQPSGNAAQSIQRSRAHRAAMLFALQREFSGNIALCKHALALARGSGNDRLICICRIDDIKLKQFITLRDFFDATDFPHIRLVNEAEVAARQLLDDFPPDANAPPDESVRVHVLLIGLGSIGQSVVLLLAQLGHYRGGLRPRVTIIDPKATQQYAALLHRFPAVADLLDIRICAEVVEFVTDNSLDSLFADGWPPSVAYACTRSEIVNLVAAKRLLRWKRARSIGDAPGESSAKFNVVIVAPPGSGLIEELGGDRRGSDNIAVLPLFAKSENIQRVMEYAKDDIARAFHTAYVSAYPKAPNAVSWEHLDEYLRNSNRLAASHVDVKLRAIGCDIEVARSDGNEKRVEDFSFSAEELVDLERIEHARWLAERRLGGWRYGPQTDKARRIHSNLVPFDDLPESEREKHRALIENIPAILAGTGRHIRRHPKRAPTGGRPG